MSDKIWNLTYKEAIDVLKLNYPPLNYTIFREALDIAIEALEIVDKLDKEGGNNG